MTRTVVGVDGSEDSEQALRWAIEHSDGEIVALGTWEYPTTGGEAVAYVPDAGYESRITEAVNRVIETVTSDEPRDVTVLVKHGHAGRVLIKESENADLLVVGSRGYGGFKGLLLGSVSTYCVHHTKCPLVVVPLPRDG